MTVDSALAEIAERGWFLHTLTQSPCGWRVYIRAILEGNSPWISYGEGATAVEALEMAITFSVVSKHIEDIGIIVPDHTPTRSILADLGIEYKFHRRI